ncbi:hypothetical protein EK21DRAFT_57580 [Setomelanomma holmii]|uniref:FAD-binding FR-type domain-containing protein n=1 Tax=Setomelanomma holmii TaxID=210430 RepID=A0A9P4HEX5_9PLEO|nr:hypothetical protein EK21DRAFT_57580 [Setomelanomma holmii]
MSHLHNAVIEAPSELDDVRYEHHLKHRGQANHRIFWSVWTGIAIVLLTILAYRVHLWWNSRRSRTHRYQRLRKSRKNITYDRATSFCEAILLSTPRGLLNLPINKLSTGKALFLTSYTLVIVVLLLAVDAPLHSAHFLDDVAFRAAWLTLTQFPLVYLLSTKSGPLNFIASLSHERVNWIHRCVTRTLLLSATVHAVIMKTSIDTNDILHSKEQGMSVVRYGIAAYGTLLWIAITSILPLRRWSYRVFYINHYIATVGFLLIAAQHVPAYARPGIYVACSILALDKVLTAYVFIRHNISIAPPLRRFARLTRGPGRARLVMGYPVHFSAPPASASGSSQLHGTTILRITNIPWSWKPGQHIRLYIPALGPLETHPFTPANCATIPAPPLPPRKDIDLENGLRAGGKGGQPPQTSEMLLLLKTKRPGGLTSRLKQEWGSWLCTPCPNATHPPSHHLTAYIDGPYGSPPGWTAYEDLVLVASSSGVSFTLAVLAHLEQIVFMGEEIRTKRVRFVWVCRHVDGVLEGVVENSVRRCADMLREAGVRIDVEFWTTCLESGRKEEMGNEGLTGQGHDAFAHLRPVVRRQISDRAPLRIRHPDEIVAEWDRAAAEESDSEDDLDPFLSWDEEGYASEHSDETEDGTLVGSFEQSDGDEEALMLDGSDGRDAMWRPLPRRSNCTTMASNQGEERCRCALIQHRRQKLNLGNGDGNLIQRINGTRPDMKSVLDDTTHGENTMVAMCANASMARDLRDVVARMKMDFAKGRRNGKVDAYIEGQD